MEAIKKYKSQFRFHLLLNVIFGVLISFASFIHIPLNDFEGYLLYFAHFLVLQFTLFGFLYFLSINRFVFVIVFPVLFFFLSGISYWVYTHDITISESIVHTTLETKPDIVLDLISVPYIMYLLLSIVAIVVVLKSYRKMNVNQLKSPLILLAFLAIVIYPIGEIYRLGVFKRRLPYNVVDSAKEYFEKNKLVLKPVPASVRANVDSLNVVFILGESVRADHLQLNGYARKTNPLLSKRKNIISFPNAYTPLSFTAISVPQILTDALLTDDYSNPKYSLIDVLNHAGIETNWIGNQTPEKSYEVFINQSKFNTVIDPLHSDLSFQKEYDEQLIPPFEKILKPGQNQFTTIHMMGSHWWYETRYPDAFRIFKPVIQSKHIPSNTKQEMVNSYDNTLVYLDYFINEIIEKIAKNNSNTLVIYLADHGELLGEGNLWLHAQKGKSIENPALILWYSDQFKAKHATMIARLESNRAKKINLDFFFPSILDLFQIEGISYDKNKAF